MTRRLVPPLLALAAFTALSVAGCAKAPSPTVPDTGAPPVDARTHDAAADQRLADAGADGGRCGLGKRACAGLCVAEASGCTCAGGARPAPAEWMAWVPKPIPTPATSYATTDDAVVDTHTCLVWQRAVPGGTFTLQQAKDYCAGLRLAGHDDWRVPTTVELLSIVERANTNPAIDSTVFPETPSTVDDNWSWSATPVARDAGYGWIVGFLYGVTSPNDVNHPSRVRCVR